MLPIGLSIMTRLRAFRERGWTPIDAAACAEAWQRFGGSVPTHPQIIEPLAALAGWPTTISELAREWRVDCRHSQLGTTSGAE